MNKDNNRIEKLTEIIRSDNIDDIIKAVLELKNFNSSSSILLLKEASHHNDLNVRYLSRKTLKETREKQLKQLSLLNEDAQLDIIRNIEKERLRYTVDFLISYFPEANQKVQIAICSALSSINDKRALEPILKYFKTLSLHPYVITTMVKTIGKLGSFEQAPILIDQLKSDDPRMRSNTIEALELIGDDHVADIIRPLLEDSSLRVKTFAAKALLSFGHDITAKHFESYLDSDDEKVRDTTIFALSQSRHSIAIGILKKQLYNHKNIMFAYNALRKIIISDLNKELTEYIIKFSKRSHNPEIKIKTNILLEDLKKEIFNSDISQKQQLLLAKEFLEILIKNQMSEKACEICEKICELIPDNNEYYYKLTKLYEQLHKYEDSYLIYYKLIHNETDNFNNIFSKIFELQEKIPSNSDLIEKILLINKISAKKIPLNVLYENALIYKLKEYREIEKYEVLFSAKIILDVLVKNNWNKVLYVKNIFESHLQYYYKCLKENKISFNDLFSIFYKLLDNKFEHRLPNLEEIETLEKYLIIIKNSYRSKKISNKDIMLINKLKRSAELLKYYKNKDMIISNIFIDMKNCDIENVIEKNYKNLSELLIHKYLAKIYDEELKDFPNAIYSYEIMLENAPENIQYHQNIAYLYYKNKNIEEAVFEYMIVIKNYIMKEKFKEASKLLSEIERIDPDNIKNSEIAIELYSKLSKKYPENIDYNKKLIFALTKKNKISTAINILRKQKFKEKQIFDIIDKLIKICETQNRIPEKIELLKLIYSYDKTNISIVEKIAELELSIDSYACLKYEKNSLNIDNIRIYLYIIFLKKEYNKIIELSKNNKEILFYDSFIFILKKIESIINKDKRLNIFNELIRIFSIRKDDNELILYYKKKLELTDDIDIYKKLGEIYYRTTKYKEAIIIYEKLYKKEPDHIEYIEKTADLYSKIDINKACKLYKEILPITNNKEKYFNLIFNIAEDKLFSGDFENSYKLYDYLKIYVIDKKYQDLIIKIISSKDNIISNLKNSFKLIKEKKYKELQIKIEEWGQNNTFYFIAEYYLNFLINNDLANKEQLYFIYGELKMFSSDFNKAIKYFNLTLGISINKLKECKKNIIICYLKMNSAVEAFNVLNTIPADIIDKNNDIKELFIYISDILTSTNNNKLAFKVIKSLYRIDPNFENLDKKIEDLGKIINE